MAHHQPKDYALVVGINDYPRYGSKGWNLKGAVGDAGRFMHWLTDTKSGGGLPAVNCRLITSSSSPLSPVRDTIDTALEELWDAAEEAGGARRLYFFFAGHGQSVTSADLAEVDVALCLPKWSRRRPYASLSSDSYWRTVKRCMPFEEIVVFLDCCRSATVRATTRKTELGCQAHTANAENVKGMVVYAAEDESRAFEGPSQESEDENLQEIRGYFTTALLNALQGAAAGPEGGVNRKGLLDYLQAEVPRLAQQSNNRQQPRIKDFGLPVDAVFGAALPLDSEQAIEPNFTIMFSDKRVGPMILLDAAATVIQQGDTRSGPWKVCMRHTLHTLLDSGTGETLSIMFRPGMEGTDVSF